MLDVWFGLKVGGGVYLLVMLFLFLHSVSLPSCFMFLSLSFCLSQWFNSDTAPTWYCFIHTALYCICSQNYLSKPTPGPEAKRAASQVTFSMQPSKILIFFLEPWTAELTLLQSRFYPDLSHCFIWRERRYWTCHHCHVTAGHSHQNPCWSVLCYPLMSSYVILQLL